MDERNEHNEQISAYDSLEPAYQRAIDLRLDQHSHQSIANILCKAGYKVKEHTVRVWFMRGGKCYIAFNEIRELRIRDLKEIVHEREAIIEEMTLHALIIINRVLTQALINDDFSPLIFRICQDSLDRGGFPRQTKSDIDTRVNVEQQESMNRMANAIELAINNTP